MCRKARQLPKLLDQVRFLDGLLTIRPASVLDRTADFDSARGVRFLGGLLNDNLSSECAGTHATLRRS